MFRHRVSPCQQKTVAFLHVHLRTTPLRRNKLRLYAVILSPSAPTAASTTAAGRAAAV